MLPFRSREEETGCEHRDEQRHSWPIGHISELDTRWEGTGGIGRDGTSIIRDRAVCGGTVSLRLFVGNRPSHNTFACATSNCRAGEAGWRSQVDRSEGGKVSYRHHPSDAVERTVRHRQSLSSAAWATREPPSARPTARHLTVETIPGGPGTLLAIRLQYYGLSSVSFAATCRASGTPRR